MSVLTPEQIALAPKGTLRADGAKRASTCCLCGAEIEPHDWVVKIKGSDAQVSCAGEYGWEIL